MASRLGAKLLWIGFRTYLVFSGLVFHIEKRTLLIYNYYY